MCNFTNWEQAVIALFLGIIAGGFPAIVMWARYFLEKDRE
jgi:hypothetical protein